MSDTTVEKRTFVQRVTTPGNRPLLIFGGVVIVVALAGSYMFGSAPPPPATSVTPSAPPHTASAPGEAAAAPPQYVRSVLTDDQTRVQTARQRGLSATPTLVTGASVDGLPTSLVGMDEAPPERPSAPTTPSPAFPVPVAAPVAQPQQQQAQTAAPIDNAMVDRMRERLSKLEAPPPVPAEVVHFVDRTQQNNALGGGAATMSAARGYGAAASAMQQASMPQAPMAAQGRRSRFRTPAAGSILFSQIKSRVNSDTPGPVLGEILQGPFSGARLLGTFAFSERGVVITFNTMSVPYRDENGDEQVEVMPIRAVAVDSANLGTAMATDIDRHILERVAVAAGTSFLQGLGQAVAQSGATALVSPYGTTVANPLLSGSNQLLVAGGAAAGAVGQIAQQYYGNRRTTITVDASTPFGLLFLGNNGSN